VHWIYASRKYPVLRSFLADAKLVISASGTRDSCQWMVNDRNWKKRTSYFRSVTLGWVKAIHSGNALAKGLFHSLDASSDFVG